MANISMGLLFAGQIYLFFMSSTNKRTAFRMSGFINKIKIPTFVWGTKYALSIITNKIIEA